MQVIRNFPCVIDSCGELPIIERSVAFQLKKSGVDYIWVQFSITSVATCPSSNRVIHCGFRDYISRYVETPFQEGDLD